MVWPSPASVLGITNPLVDEFNAPAREAEEARRRQWDEWRQRSLNNVWQAALDYDSLPPEKKAATDFVADPLAARKLGIVQAYLTIANRNRAPKSEIETAFLRDAVAAAKFDRRGTGDSMAFYAEIAREAKEHKDQRDLNATMEQPALAHALFGAAGQDVTGYWSEWRESAKGKPAYRPSLDWIYRERWDALVARARTASEPYAPQLARVYDAMQKGQSTTGAAWEAYFELDEEERQGFAEALGLLARAMPEEQRRNFVENFSAQGLRDIRSLGRDARDFASMAGCVVPGPPTVESVTNALRGVARIAGVHDFVADVTRIAEQQFDPVKTRAQEGSGLALLERGIYAMPGAVATTAMMAVPGAGAPLMLGTMQLQARDDLRFRLLEAGVPRDQAALVSSAMGPAIGALQYLPERLSFGVMTRRMPGVNKVFHALSDRITNRVARFVVAGGEVTATETVTELVQDALVVAGHELAAALEPQIPSPDLRKEIGDLLAEAPTIAVATIPLAMFGGMGGLNAEARAAAFSRASPRTLRALGVREEDIEAINEAKDRGPASVNLAVDEAWKNRDPESETAKAELEALEAEAKAAAGAFASTEFLPRATATAEGFRLTDPETGAEIGTAATPAEAAALAMSHWNARRERSAELTAAMFTYLETTFSGSAAIAKREAAAGKGDTGETELGLGLVRTIEAELAEHPDQEARVLAELKDELVAAGAEWETAEQAAADLVAALRTRRIVGKSETDMEALKQGVKRSLTRLWAGASILTQFHEDWHAQWRYALDAGRLTRSGAIRILRAVDTVAKGRTTRAGRELRFLPEDDAAITDELLDERIAQLAEAEVIRRRRKGGRAGMPLPPGIVSRNLSALLQIAGEPMGRFAQILHAFRKFYELVLKRAVLIDKGIREGTINEAEFEDFIDRLLGLEDQTTIDQAAEASAAELAGFEMEPDKAAALPVGAGDPFSLAPRVLSSTPEARAWFQKDLKDQLPWLLDIAKQKGYASLDAWAKEDKDDFDGHCEAWRTANPVPEAYLAGGEEVSGGAQGGAAEGPTGTAYSPAPRGLIEPGVSDWRQFVRQADFAGDPALAERIGRARAAVAKIADGHEKRLGFLPAPAGGRSNLTRAQWIDVRTPAFKDWFGDWEGNLKRLFLDGPAVSTLYGTEFAKQPDASLVDRVAAWFEQEHGGHAVNPVLGKVLLNKKGVSGSIGHGIGRNKAAAFAAVPDAIRDGMILRESRDYRAKGVDRFILGAPIRIGAGAYVVTVIVQRDQSTQRLYLHEVWLKEKLRSSSKTAASAAGTTGELHGTDAGAMQTILRDIFSVNPESVSGAVDANGEPAVSKSGDGEAWTGRAGDRKTTPDSATNPNLGTYAPGTGQAAYALAPAEAGAQGPARGPGGMRFFGSPAATAYALSPAGMADYYAAQGIENPAAAARETGDLFEWAKTAIPPAAEPAPAAPEDPNYAARHSGRMLAMFAESAMWGQRPDTESLGRGLAQWMRRTRQQASVILAGLTSRAIPAWNPVGTKLAGPEDIFALNAAFRNPYFESVRVMVVDSANRVIEARVQTIGNVNESIYDMKDLAGMLAVARARHGPKIGLVVSHNHPGGNAEPSTADNLITANSRRMCQALGVRFVDHVVTNGTEGYSYAQGAKFKMPATFEPEWSAVPRAELAQVQEPDILHNMASAMRAGNPKLSWIVYLNTRLGVIGMNILPADTAKAGWKANIARRISEDLRVNGAHSCAVLLARDIADPTSVLEAVSAFAGTIQLRFLDGIHFNAADNLWTNYRQGLGGFDTRSAAFSLAPAEVAEALGEQARRRIADPEERAKYWQQVARNMARLRRQLQTVRLVMDGVELEVPLEGRLTPDEITAKVSAFREQRRGELEGPIWAKFEALLVDDDLVRLTAQPVHSVLFNPATKRGRLMSKAAAASRGVPVDQLALWDGADGIWSGVFGGTLMPDVALASINDALLMMTGGHGAGSKLESVDQLWEALRAEQAQVAHMREALKSAKDQLAEAKARALAEAREYRRLLEQREEVAQSPKQRLLRAIGTLEGILSALPAPVRVKVGGYRQLITAGTDETRFRILQGRLEQADEELEKFLRAEYDRMKVELFERAKPAKDEIGKRRQGQAGYLIHGVFDVLRLATTWTHDEAKAHADAIDRWLEDGIQPAPEIMRRVGDWQHPTPEEEFAFGQESYLVLVAARWIERNAADREAFVLAATRLWEGGYYDQVRKRIEEREKLEARRDRMNAATGAVGTPPARAEAAKKRAGWKGRMEDLLLGGLSFDNLMRWIYGEDQDALEMIDRERACAAAKADRVFAAQDDLERTLATLAGGKTLAGEKLHYKLAHNEVTVHDARTGQAYTLPELDALGATMLWAQPDGQRHMIGHLDDDGNPTGEWHYNQAFIDEIENQLSNEAKALRFYLWAKYEENFPRLNETHRRLWGIDLARVQGTYSPLTVQPTQAAAGAGLVDPITGATGAPASFVPSSLRTRSQAIAEPIFRDPLVTYLAHIRQTEHWIAYAELTRDLRGLLTHKETRSRVEETTGKQAVDLMGGWLQQFALGGTTDAGAYLELMRWLGRGIGRAARVALIGRASTVAVQATQLGAAMAEMPTADYLVRLAKLFTGQLGWGTALRSVYIQRRLRDMPVIVQAMMDALRTAKPTRVNHLVRELGKLIPGADALWTAGTYAITYDYQLKLARKPRSAGGLGLQGDEATRHARNVAERIVDRLAQPVRAGTRSMWENASGNAAMRIGWAFASEARKNLGMTIYSMARGTAGQKARTLAYLFLTNALLSHLIRAVIRDVRDDRDEEVFDERNWSPKRLALLTATDPFKGLPFVGDALQAAVFAGAGEWRMEGNMFSSLTAAGRGIGKIPETLAGERDVDQVIMDLDGILSGMGIFSETLAAYASLAHLAKDLFGVVRNLATE